MRCLDVWQLRAHRAGFAIWPVVKDLIAAVALVTFFVAIWFGLTCGLPHGLVVR
jgi:hypothetical protein